MLLLPQCAPPPPPPPTLSSTSAVVNPCYYLNNYNPSSLSSSTLFTTNHVQPLAPTSAIMPPSDANTKPESALVLHHHYVFHHHHHAFGIPAQTHHQTSSSSSLLYTASAATKFDHKPVLVDPILQPTSTSCCWPCWSQSPSKAPSAIVSSTSNNCCSCASCSSTSPSTPSSSSSSSSRSGQVKTMDSNNNSSGSSTPAGSRLDPELSSSCSSMESLCSSFTPSTALSSQSASSSAVAAIGGAVQPLTAAGAMLYYQHQQPPHLPHLPTIPTIVPIMPWKNFYAQLGVYYQPVPWNQSFGMERVWMSEFRRIFSNFYTEFWSIQPVEKKPNTLASCKLHMFVDSAKVRFCCERCSHSWTSMKGRVVFWFNLLPPNFNVGIVAIKLFGQRCESCKQDNQFEQPMWYPEEVTKVLVNLYNRVGQIFHGFEKTKFERQRRMGKPRTQHNKYLCQACLEGICLNRSSPTSSSTMAESSSDATGSIPGSNKNNKNVTTIIEPNCDTSSTAEQSDLSSTPEEKTSNKQNDNNNDEQL